MEVLRDIRIYESRRKRDSGGCYKHTLIEKVNIRTYVRTYGMHQKECNSLSN